MDPLKNNLHLLQTLKDIVKNKSSEHFTYESINNNEYTDKTISIVMTSHERSKQVYYTLHTISQSSIKDIQVIIVDDSSYDMVNIDVLKHFSFNIELIRINRDNKCWINPCINYNIGFEFIKGSKVIIQNSEVCHIGDVLKYVDNNVKDNGYYSFDVSSSHSFEINEVIYKYGVNPSQFKNLNFFWYQHHQFRNVYYHFLAALSRTTFNIIKNFSYDYSFDLSYDDDDLIFKLKILQIKLINVINEVENVGGIHLYHSSEHKNSSNKLQNPGECNKLLFTKKIEYFNCNKKYLEISDGNNIEEITKLYNML